MFAKVFCVVLGLGIAGGAAVAVVGANSLWAVAPCGVAAGLMLATLPWWPAPVEL